MSLRLLLDEDSQAKLLVDLLRNANHDVMTVNEANLMGKPDSVVLDYARKNLRLLLTRNCNDFLILHKLNNQHPGILAVYQNFDFTKNMSYQDIVKSITNLEASAVSFENDFICLNQWQY